MQKIINFSSQADPNQQASIADLGGEDMIYSGLMAESNEAGGQGKYHKVKKQFQQH